MTGYWRKDDIPDSDSESVIGYWRKDDIPDSDSESMTGYWRKDDVPDSDNEWLLVTGESEEQWSCGRAPDCQSRGRWFNPTYRRFETSAISFISHLPVSFRRDTKSQ